MVPGKPKRYIMLTYIVTAKRQLPYTDLTTSLCVWVQLKAMA